MARLSNRLVITLLQSPRHRLLSRSTDLVRYTTNSGRTIMTPTQYVDVNDGIAILVAHPDSKTWWRHFRTEQPIEILRRRVWRTMNAQALAGADNPGALAPLLDAYLTRFPLAARTLDGATRDDKISSALIVWSQPGRAPVLD